MTKDERFNILRLLRESATLQKQITQADSYLSVIKAERERLDREEKKTISLRERNVARKEQCDRERAELEADQ